MKASGLIILIISLLAACAKEPLYETPLRDSGVIYIDNKPVTITEEKIGTDTILIITAPPFHK
jgi:hypothetical protein